MSSGRLKDWRKINPSISLRTLDFYLFFFFNSSCLSELVPSLAVLVRSTVSTLKITGSICRTLFRGSGSSWRTVRLLGIQHSERISIQIQLIVFKCLTFTKDHPKGSVLTSGVCLNSFFIYNQILVPVSYIRVLFKVCGLGL